MSAIDEPVQLAPPGAGLPAAELAVVRPVFAIARALLSRQRADGWFERETERILRIVESLAPEEAQRRVLIARVRGIEDSSRNWSAWMTLEHLVIVNTAIGKIIEQLAGEKSVSGKVSTADPKPMPVTDAEIVKRYRVAAKAYLRTVRRLDSLNSSARHVHPWFGPLNAHGWHCLAAIHQTIHRRQLEAIVRGLRDGS
jgi:hypothetical protein